MIKIYISIDVLIRMTSLDISNSLRPTAQCLQYRLKRYVDAHKISPVLYAKYHSQCKRCKSGYICIRNLVLSLGNVHMVTMR